MFLNKIFFDHTNDLIEEKGETSFTFCYVFDDNENG